MFFKKKKPFVRFVNLMPGVELVHPVIRAKEQKYEWFRKAAQDYKEKLKTFNGTDFAISATRCPGIIQLLGQGFIITAPMDFTITTDSARPGWFEWRCPTHFDYGGYQYISGHSPEQLYEFTPQSFREDTLETIIKVSTRWRADSSEDLIFIQMPIPYPDHDLFSAAHGIVDVRESLLEVNVQLFWHKKDGTHHVKAGTPLCQWIAIPRNMAVDLKVERMNATDRYISSAYEFIAKKDYHKNMKSFFENCRKLFALRDKN